LYVDHDPNYHFFTFRPEHRARLRPAALFDLVINNADRKGGHIIVDAADHIWLIDHGISFHTEDKLRTVIWDFAGEPLPDNLTGDLKTLNTRLLKTEDKLTSLLKQLLSADEILAISMRVDQLLREDHFPQPATDRRPFPWPPV